MKVNRFILSLYFVLSVCALLAQDFHFSDTLVVRHKTEYVLLPSMASSLRLTVADSFGKYITIEAGDQEFEVKNFKEYHQEEHCYFLIFEEPISKLTIKSEGNLKLVLDYFYAPKIQLNLETIHLKKIDCEKPATISYESWRQGLPAPKPGRVETVIKHCIIHHTAGSNSNTDYVNAVRNIYLAHTEGNGWDDIGYNYLIAPNGIIFSGRDPQGVSDEDNIQGAHFCSKNSGTMGIALIGNYNLVRPSHDMLESLRELITWKLFKEKLNPFGELPHPSALEDPLGTIAIHQDGCATECPGDSMVLEVNNLKAVINEKLEDCGLFLGRNTTSIFPNVVVFPNPTLNHFTIENNSRGTVFYVLLNGFGATIKSGELSSNRINLDVAPGTYTLITRNESGNQTIKKLVRL